MEPTYSDDDILTVPNGPDDVEPYEPLVPTSYLEDGVRIIIVRDEDTDIRYFYDRETGSMSECAVF